MSLRGFALRLRRFVVLDLSLDFAGKGAGLDAHAAQAARRRGRLLTASSSWDGRCALAVGWRMPNLSRVTHHHRMQGAPVTCDERRGTPR